MLDVLGWKQQVQLRVAQQRAGGDAAVGGGSGVGGSGGDSSAADVGTAARGIHGVTAGAHANDGPPRRFKAVSTAVLVRRETGLKAKKLYMMYGARPPTLVCVVA